MDIRGSIKNNLENKKRINEILIVIFLGVSIFFTYDFYKLKKISFLLLVIVNVRLLVNSCLNKKNFFKTFYGLIFPTMVISISGILTGNLFLAFTRGFSMYLFLLIFIIDEYDIEYRKICRIFLIGLASFIIFLGVTDMLGIFNISTSVVTEFIYKYDMGFVGKDPSQSFYYKIFLRASPLIVILVFDYFEKKKIIPLCIVYIALIFTGTRANVGITVIGILIYVFYKLLFTDTKKYYKLIALGLIFLISSIFIMNIEFLMDVFITKSNMSDSIKFGHFTGVLESIKDNPNILLYGSGLGSWFFSNSTGWVNTIEISYIDLIRQIGIPMFLIYVVFLVYPLFKLRQFKYNAFLLLTYLAIAGTNPLLLNSTGYILYIYIYSYSKGRGEIKNASEYSCCSL